MKIQAFVCGWAILVAVGCGEVSSNKPDAGGGGDAPGGGDFSLSIDPATLTLPVASTGTVTVTITRDGSVGDVMLSASGLGSGLTAEFTPNPISAGETTAELKVTAVGGMQPATSTVTITGSSGGMNHTASLSVTTTAITVSGTVRGGRAGVIVGITGKASVISSAGGLFVFTDVIPPYDLYTKADGGSSTSPSPTVFFFDNLTKPDPVVSAPATFTPGGFKVLCGLIASCPASAVSGTKSGSGNNTSPVVFAWSGPDGRFKNGVLNSNGSFSGTAEWNSGTSNQGNLFAIQLTRRASGAPDAFLGFAKSATTDLDDDQPETINLAFSPVNSTATVTGTVSGPAGYDAANISLMQEFGPTQTPLWTTNTTTTVDATFPLIAAAGGNALYAFASLADVGSSVFVQPLTATTTVDFSMPSAAVISGPADGQSGVTASTMFTWDAPDNVISQVTFGPTSTSGTSKNTFVVFTTSKEISLPIIPELQIPPGQSYNWRVVGYGPNTTIDAAVAANELESVSSADYDGPAHAQTFSVTRGFTTQ